MQLFEPDEVHKNQHRWARWPYGIHCERCGTGIPSGERRAFKFTGLCSWCEHMLGKMARE